MKKRLIIIGIILFFFIYGGLGLFLFKHKDLIGEDNLYLILSVFWVLTALIIGFILLLLVLGGIGIGISKLWEWAKKYDENHNL